MRILVTGDRFWECPEIAEQVLNQLLARYGSDMVVVHGGAPGVDQSFAVACRDLGITAEPHATDWQRSGIIAGPARNRVMVESEADLCIAVHRSLATCEQTKDCVRQALAAGIPTYLIEDELAVPARLQEGGARLA